jgi:nicotinate-nucleotide--dimethylbenzimidazole phosphoribosyltransferase
MDFTIAPATRDLDAALRRKIDQKTKPLGALGRLEALALQIGRVRNSLTPTLSKPHIVVLAGDHGAARAGISAYPQDVTWQMVENFLAGGAAINVFARANGIGLTIGDAGVAHEFGARPNLVDAKVSRDGTASYLDGAAMTAGQRDAAMAKGAEIVAQLARDGCEVVGFGEMGIGNTASASLITHCLTELPLAACVGRGTGLDDAGLARKQALLEQALAAWAGRNGKPLDVLARYGGFEIAMMAGAMLAAAQAKMLVLVDGFICGAAALTAARIAPTSSTTPCSATPRPKPATVRNLPPCRPRRWSRSTCGWARARARRWPGRWCRPPAPSSTRWPASNRPASAKSSDAA